MAASADVLLHPVRLRVVQALLGDRRLTTAELGAELADVPAATLYRHVGTLADAGVLVVAGERKVRGAVERTWALRVEAARIGPDEAARMSPEDHRRGVTAFVAGLLHHVDRWAAHPGADAARDGLGYSVAGLWLTDAELAQLGGELGRLLEPLVAQGPGEGRRRRLHATVVVPAEELSPAASRGRSARSG